MLPLIVFLTDRLSRPPDRRVQLLPLAALLGLLLAPAPPAALAQPARPEVGGELPTSGIADPAFASFDRTMGEFMRRRGIPGGALAVVKDGRLVYARGYGYADRERKTGVGVHSLFRIASISKTLTGVAVLTLAQDPRYHLDLDAPAFRLLGYESRLVEVKGQDPRVRQITVRQLLHHTGGWDRDRSGDPMFDPFGIAKSQGVPPPAGPDAIIRSVLARPPDFDPGSRYCYSNFGYCVLGRVIERVSGQSYEAYVTRAVLGPMGIKGMRLGHSLVKDRAPGEVRYYQPSDGLARPVLAASAREAAGVGQVPWPDGGFYLEAMDSHGGWLASALDLARFAAGMDRLGHGRRPAEGLGGPAVLKGEWVRVLYEPPAAPVARKAEGALADWWYGCGWMVRPTGGGKANYWHAGSLPGTCSLLVRRSDGLSWVALFNQRSSEKSAPDADLDAALHRAADAVREWPGHDLFEHYGYGK